MKGGPGGEDVFLSLTSYGDLYLYRIGGIDRGWTIDIEHRYTTVHVCGPV